MVKLKVLVTKMSENRFFYQVTSVRGKVYGTGIAESYNLEGTTFTAGCMKFYNVKEISIN